MDKSSFSKDTYADKSLNSKVASDTLVSIDSAVVRSLFKMENSGNGNSRGCCTFIKQHKIMIWMERIILIFICIAIAGGFTVPIIIYVRDTDQAGNNTRSISDFNLHNCANTSRQVFVT